MSNMNIFEFFVWTMIGLAHFTVFCATLDVDYLLAALLSFLFVRVVLVDIEITKLPRV